MAPRVLGAKIHIYCLNLWIRLACTKVVTSTNNSFTAETEMRKKLKLDVETLRVDSFETKHENGEGTVHAHNDPWSFDWGSGCGDGCTGHGTCDNATCHSGCTVVFSCDSCVECEPMTA
jgi:hypothetical protein